MSEIDDAPTIEVTDFIEYHLDEISRTLHYRVVKDEPVKHGRWIKHEGYDECNLCHTKTMFGHNYCPNCGAKMEVDNG
jgi:hypothetical protein